MSEREPSGNRGAPEATLTPAELAAELGVTTKELKTWRDAGKGPAWTLVTKRTVRYLRIDVDQWKGNHPTRRP